MDDGKQWLSYAEAAKRVQRSTHTIQIWRKAGMPMRWQQDETGRRYRVVELDVLLEWWREKMQSSPVHYYRLRKRAADAGEAPPQMPDRFKEMCARATQPRARQDDALTPGADDRTGDERTEAEEEPQAPKVDPIADMKPLKSAAEYAVLTDRLRVTAPACAEMPEYTADWITTEDRDRMRGICAACPLLAECQAFAIASKPKAGFWPTGLTLIRAAV